MTTTSARPACPSCGSSDTLSTIEELQGLSPFVATADGLNHAGETDVLWDLSTTVGVSCACGFEHLHGGAMSDEDVLSVLR